MISYTKGLIPPKPDEPPMIFVIGAATVEIVKESRDFTTKHFESLGYPSDVLDTARLTVSELVTNAHRHAFGPVSVHLYTSDDHPVIEVRDGSQTLPTPIPLDDESLLGTSGRGLAMLALMVHDLTAGLLPTGGKTVIAKLPTSPPTPEHDHRTDHPTPSINTTAPHPDPT